MTDPSDEKGSPALPTKHTPSLDLAELRRQAEEAVRHQKPPDIESLSLKEARKMLHELQVHKIELEMQNEELRQAQEEIDASRTRYFDLYDLAPVSYFTVSKEGLILKANLTAANMLGIARGELVKRPITRLILKEDEDKFYFLHKKLLETSEPQECDLRMVKKDSTITWVWMGAILAGTTDGAPVLNIAISDITARKKAEEELKKAHDELEVRVEERTADLKRINEALRQSNLALEDFAHVAAHDLQEPLRKVMTFAERLTSKRNDSLSDQDRDYLTRMQSAAGRMRLLINELIKYSLVTSDHHSPKIINLKKPVEDAAGDLSMILDESGGRIVIDELPDVEANETQMRQLFQNLIGNSLKYRSDQTPLIRIYNSPSSNNKFHEIHVTDNGIGFEKIYLDKIFKPFQRLHARSSSYHGTGMGLAICLKIVEHHGGSITAKSEPGKGSTFIVRLPKPASPEDRLSCSPS